MSDVDVSVIVPILNGESFLDNCIGFLRAQTHSNFEIILVVDGTSSDNTLEIAQKYSDMYDNIRILIQNEGYKLSGNRNLGLTSSLGKAVWFVDVDDAPAPDFIRDMLNLLESTESDFVCCNFINTSPSGVVVEKRGAKYHTKVMNREEAILSRRNDEFPVSSWSKLFRRDFLVDNGLYFEESYAEDIAHTYKCVDKCSRICIYDRPLYAYRQTPNSICRNKANIDKRGYAEIESYEVADKICEGDLASLKRNAIMKIRSSGHMSYRTFMQFAKSEKNRASYEKYLKGSPEAWWHLHLSSSYWLAIRIYVALVYKRNGTKAMNKKFW